jgi:sucrose-6-phosphate hydrolase SacC (GH32 family)
MLVALLLLLLPAGTTAGSPDPYAGRCSPLWPGDPKAHGCWAWDWQFAFHPVTTSSPTVGDSSGGLHINGSWHFFYSCQGGWCHLETQDLVNYESHGIVHAGQSRGWPKTLDLGTGSVTAAADGSGDILAYCNNQAGHMRSTDGMKTWTAYNTTTVGSPGGRDQARPLQSSDGTWFQMMGCSAKKKADGAGVCRFKARDDTLANWKYDGNIFESNATWSVMGGNSISFYEVPDFYPLTNSNGVTKHVLVVDPWGNDKGYHVHNVEWRSGTWSADGSSFSVEQTGVLDYGWWYAARSITTMANKGSDRRLMSGNIGTDVTHGAAPVGGSVLGAGGIRMFTSLPREISLAEDGSTVHVKPPVELSEGLRISGAAPKTATVPSFTCGQQTLLGSNVSSAEFRVRKRSFPPLFLY